MKKVIFLLTKKVYLCDRSFFHPMKSRKDKYIPGYLINKMKEILNKIGLGKGLLEYIQVKIFLS